MMTSEDPRESRELAATPEGRRMPLDWQPRFTRVVLAGALFLGLIVLAPAVYFGVGSLATIILIAVLLAGGVAVLLRGSYNMQVASALALLAAAGIAVSFGGSAPSNGIFFFLALLTVATLLWSPAAGAAATLFSLIVAIIGGIIAVIPSGSSAQGPAGWIGMALAVLLFGLALGFGVRYLLRGRGSAGVGSAASSATTQEVGPPAGVRRPDTAEAMAKAIEIGRVANSLRDPVEIAARIPRLAAEGFSCRSAELYLVNDQGNQAVLSGTSDDSAGAQLKDPQPIALDDPGSIAEAIRTRQTCVVPESRGGIAVPLTLGNEVLGALVMLPIEAAGLDPAALDAIKALAGQLAVAIDTARAFQDAKRAAGGSQAAPRQAQPATWKPYAETTQLEYKMGMPDGPVATSEMNVPLSLRDETIGNISLAADADWSDEQRNLVEAVATQAALALENARLVEASQLSARREHMLAEITGKVWASPTIEGILRTAVEELGQALDAERAIIQLNMESNDGN